MLKPDTAVLQQLLSEVFGTFAMMFTDEATPDTHPTPDCKLVLTTMTFKGPDSGVFELVLPETVCPEITANVLGYDAEDEFVIENKADGVRELLNVIGGNALMKLTGDRNLYDVGIPEVQELPAERWDEMAEDPEAIVLSVDDRPVLFRMKVKA